MPTNHPDDIMYSLCPKGSLFSAFAAGSVTCARRLDSLPPAIIYSTDENGDPPLLSPLSFLFTPHVHTLLTFFLYCVGDNLLHLSTASFSETTPHFIAAVRYLLSQKKRCSLTCRNIIYFSMRMLLYFSLCVNQNNPQICDQSTNSCEQLYEKKCNLSLSLSIYLFCN